MTSFLITTAEEFEGTRFGGYLLDIVGRLELPLPKIKGIILKKFNREGCWGIKVTQPGRDTEPKVDGMEIKLISDSKEKGLDLIMQDLIARLCGRHSKELKGHYSYFFGRRSEDGEPYYIDAKDKKMAKPVCSYLQDLEILLNDLHEDPHVAEQHRVSPVSGLPRRRCSGRPALLFFLSRAAAVGARIRAGGKGRGGPGGRGAHPGGDGAGGEAGGGRAATGWCVDGGGRVGGNRDGGGDFGHPGPISLSGRERSSRPSWWRRQRASAWPESTGRCGGRKQEWRRCEGSS